MTKKVIKKLEKPTTKKISSSKTKTKPTTVTNPKKTTTKSTDKLASVGPKRRSVPKRNVTLAAKKRTALSVKRTPKLPKIKFRWGIITDVVMNSGFSMDYLLGRYVKILPTSTENRLNCIIQSPGYEGVNLPFSPNEITEVPSKPTKERMQNAYLTSVNKAGINIGFESIDGVEIEEETKTTKKRKNKV
jgi:hypothetical protein